MKKLFLLIGLFAIISLKSTAQYSFGINPGLGASSAFLGYKVGKKITLLGSFQYFNLNGGLSVQKTGGDEFSSSNSASISFIIPSLGIRYAVYQKENLNGFLFGNLTKPFLSSKINIDGVDNIAIQEEINKISTFGGEFGFGTQYFLSEQFSLTGEFGIHFYHFDYKTEEAGEEFNNNTNTNEPVLYKYKASLNFNPTFSRIGFNFHF